MFRRLAETPLKTLNKLGRKSDLRYQYQRLSAARQYPFDNVQIDLGLATAGDAFQYKCLIVFQCLDDGSDGILLPVVERDTGCLLMFLWPMGF